MHYFFSYARADATPFLERFYCDLLEVVRSKIGAQDPAAVGFRDARSIEPGSSWPDAIAEALRSCKVYVYLHTPTYFTRDGCGREFEVIKQRLSAARASTEFQQASCIQPIYWDGPKVLQNVPNEISRTNDAYNKVYNEEGMLHLVRIAYDKDIYWETVNAIAKRIHAAAEKSPLPELRQPPIWNKIIPLFPVAAISNVQRSGDDRPRRSPRHARFVWIVGTRDELRPLRDVDCYDPDDIAEEWRPFIPHTTDPGRLIAADAAREARLTYVPEEFKDPEDFRQLVHRCGDEYTPVVVVVDLWSLRLDKYRAVVRIFDKIAFTNCSVVFPWNNQDAATIKEERELQRALSDVFPIQYNKPDTLLKFSQIRDLHTFKSELAALLAGYAGDIKRSLKAARMLPESGFPALPQLAPAPGAPR